MGELGSLIEAWRDRRDPRPSDAWIAEKVGAKSRSSVRPWLTGESMPTAEHLRRLAAIIGVNYRTVLDAALLDAGYLTEMEHRGHAAPTSPAGDDPAAGNLSTLSAAENVMLRLAKTLKDDITVGELRTAAGVIVAPGPGDPTEYGLAARRVTRKGYDDEGSSD